MTQATSIAALIGANLRAWREAAGLRQDDVAGAARALGFRWTRTTVAALELGQRDIYVGELLALPLIVESFPTGRRSPWRRFQTFLTTPPQWQGAGGWDRTVALNADAWIRVDDLFNLVIGKPVVGGTAAVHSTAKTRREIARRVAAEFDAELKVAGRLGVSGDDVVSAARRLWGRSLTHERDARVAAMSTADATPRTLQALRGHITRALVAELRAVLPPARVLRIAARKPR